MSDAFVQSINKVTQLLRSNNQLRDSIEKISKDKDEMEKKLLQMNLENERLTQRIDNLMNAKETQSFSSVHLPKIKMNTSL